MGVIAVTALSWSYLVVTNMSPNGDGIMRMAMPGMAGAALSQFTAALLMWTVMMVGRCLVRSAADPAGGEGAGGAGGDPLLAGRLWEREANGIVTNDPGRLVTGAPRTGGAYR